VVGQEPSKIGEQFPLVQRQNCQEKPSKGLEISFTFPRCTLDKNRENPLIPKIIDKSGIGTGCAFCTVSRRSALRAQAAVAIDCINVQKLYLNKRKLCRLSTAENTTFSCTCFWASAYQARGQAHGFVRWLFS
jgi:hypothetical protein